MDYIYDEVSTVIVGVFATKVETFGFATRPLRRSFFWWGFFKVEFFVVEEWGGQVIGPPPLG